MEVHPHNTEREAGRNATRRNLRIPPAKLVCTLWSTLRTNGLAASGRNYSCRVNGKNPSPESSRTLSSAHPARSGNQKRDAAFHSLPPTLRQVASSTKSVEPPLQMPPRIRSGLVIRGPKYNGFRRGNFGPAQDILQRLDTGDRTGSAPAPSPKVPWLPAKLRRHPNAHNSDRC
jgi:hypothetical protein